MWLGFLFALALQAQAQPPETVDDIDQYDYGARSSHYVAPALKELVTEAPRCLPAEVVVQMSAWLLRLQQLTQHRLLHAVGLQRLIREMQAGQSLCAALPAALARMYRKHELSLRQREALDALPEEGSGWLETQRQMRDALDGVEQVCRAAEARAAATNETRWAPARDTLQCLKRVEKEYKKKVQVYHFE